VGVALSVALSGSEATVSAGNVTPPGGVDVTGVGASSSAGSVGPASSVPLVGASATATPGTVSPVTSSELEGAGASASPGDVSPGLQTVGVEAPSSAGNVGAHIIVALTGVGGVTSAGIILPAHDLVLSGVEVVSVPGVVAPRFSIVLTGLVSTALGGTLSPPVPEPPTVVLTTAINDIITCGPSPKNTSTAGRSLAASYCDWAMMCRSQLGAYPKGLTTTGYLYLSRELGRVLGQSGPYLNVVALEFANAVASMWKYSGVTFGDEPVLTTPGTQDLAMAIYALDPYLLLQSAIGQDMYDGWYILSEALIRFTIRMTTASGRVTY